MREPVAHKETAVDESGDGDTYVLVPHPDGGQPMAVFSDGSYVRWTPAVITA